MSEIWDEPFDHFVYRLYDSEGVLLYVGCAKNFRRRMGQHAAKSAAFIPVVAQHTIDGPFRRTVALAIESTAIRREQPIFNRRQNNADPRSDYYRAYYARHRDAKRARYAERRDARREAVAS